MLDTNVVVSALAFGGVPRLLLEAGAAQTVQLFTSPALLAELREVLARDHIATRLAPQHRNVAQALAFYEQGSNDIPPRPHQFNAPRSRSSRRRSPPAMPSRSSVMNNISTTP